jgi:hypothetical protein
LRGWSRKEKVWRGGKRDGEKEDMAKASVCWRKDQR